MDKSKEYVFVERLVNKDPDSWSRFIKPGSTYRELFDESIDTLEKEFDLTGTAMAVSQARRDELFNVFCDYLKENDCYYLKKYLSDDNRPSFRSWLRVKTLYHFYDKIVSVTQTQLVSNLINRKKITTDIFFYGSKKNLSILPSIVSYLKNNNLIKIINPKDISTLSYQVFMRRVNSFQFKCSLITYFYDQRFFRDAVDEYFGKDRHKLYKFLDLNSLSAGNQDSDTFLQEDSYQCIIQTTGMKTAYNDQIISSLLMDEPDDSSIDDEFNTKIRDLIYRKMIADGHKTAVEMLKERYENKAEYDDMVVTFKTTKAALRTGLSRARKTFSTYLNNCPKEMRIDIVKQIDK